MNYIKLFDIGKHFQDGYDQRRHVLNGIKMDIDRGEFVAIKGESGSGKTTLLSILGTLIQPDRGSYLLEGEEMVAPNTDHSFTRSVEIGFVFQDYRLLPQYTVFENILLPTLARAEGATKTDITYARELMKLMNLFNISDQYPATLSGGEASRVAICRALIRKPSLLLADEPTGQLDRKNARNIGRLFLDINAQLETTIVMVTHSDETASVAHRCLTLKGGNLL